ncbi:MAG: hypothetical protein M3R70_04080 [Actinomycetota bacterium]|nr:hypothetical protein [Actinomycetota bacterium]
MTRAGIGLALSAAAGVASWLAINSLYGGPEAWDNSAYLPTMFAVAFLLGIVVGGRFGWVGVGIGLATPQLALLVTMGSGSKEFLPFGVIIFVFLGGLWTIVAWFGGQVRRFVNPLAKPSSEY